jgi:aldose 1-epimerase
MMSLKNDNLKGYNTFFIKNNDYTKTLAFLWNKSSGRIVDMHTSMPGVLVYTGDFLSEPFAPFGGICLEAQYHTDGVNNPSFKTCILSPNIEKTDMIEYRFWIYR